MVYNSKKIEKKRSNSTQTKILYLNGKIYENEKKL